MLVVNNSRARLVTIAAFVVIVFIAFTAFTYNPELTDGSSQYLKKSWSKLANEQAWLGADKNPVPPSSPPASGQVPSAPQTPQEALPFNPQLQEKPEADLPSTNPNPFAAGLPALAGNDATTESSSSSSTATTFSTSTTAVGFGGFGLAPLPTSTLRSEITQDIITECPPSHDELYSQHTPHGEYFAINFYKDKDNTHAFNPSLLPHPQLLDTWIAVAQSRFVDREFTSAWSSEITCTAKFLPGGNLTCLDPPTNLIVPATQSTEEFCTGKLKPLLMNIGPHDARALFGPEYPYLVYGTQSEYTCFGQWVQDFRLIQDWGIFRGWDVFQVPTEIQRPPPLGPMEKNYYLFWDVNDVMYSHYDTAPKRAFAKLEADGSAGPDLAPKVYEHDERCWKKHLALNPIGAPEPYKFSIHQASNSLSVTMCNSTDPTCIPSASNTFIIAIYQHKIGNGLMHARYEPHVMVFQKEAPFAVHAITAKPLWIRGRKSIEDMIYVTSINWKMRGLTYSAFLDDIIHVNFGIEDRRTASIDVLAGDLLRNLMLCDD